MPEAGIMYTYYLPEDFRLADLIAMMGQRLLLGHGMQMPALEHVEFYDRFSDAIEKITAGDHDFLFGHKESAAETLADLEKAVQSLLQQIATGEKEKVVVRRFVQMGIATIHRERQLWGDATQHASTDLAAMLAGLHSMHVPCATIYQIVAPLLSFALTQVLATEKGHIDVLELYASYVASLSPVEAVAYRELAVQHVRSGIAAYREERNALLLAQIELTRDPPKVVTGKLIGVEYDESRAQQVHRHEHAQARYIIIVSANSAMIRAARVAFGQQVDVIVQLHPREQRLVVVARREFGGLDHLTARLRERETCRHVPIVNLAREDAMSRTHDNERLDLVFSHPSANVVGNMDPRRPASLQDRDALREIVIEVLTGTY